MEKRSFKRISTSLKATFCCCGVDYYSATVTNFSENGMFIDTQICFPVDSQVDILLISNEEIIRVPAKICWVRKSVNSYDGIGVMILNPSEKYLDFLKNISTS